MGNLFPEDDLEFPDYRPMPSVTATVRRAGGMTTFATAVGLAPLCPVHDHPAEPPHHTIYSGEHLPVIPMSAMGSTSGVPMPFQGNSLDAANQVVRRGYARRDAQFRSTINSMVAPVLTLK